jgi:hypothetical protein
MRLVAENKYTYGAMECTDWPKVSAGLVNRSERTCKGKHFRTLQEIKDEEKFNNKRWLVKKEKRAYRKLDSISVRPTLYILFSCIKFTVLTLND